MNNLKMSKLFFEIRYPPSGVLFDKKGEIADQWRGKNDFTDWEIGPTGVNLFNVSSKSVSFQVEYRKAIYISESPERYRVFREYAQEAILDTIKRLELNHLDRLGLRMLFFKEHKNFKAVVSNIMNTFHNNIPDDMWKVFGGAPVIDINPSFLFDLGDRELHFSITPMKKEDLLQQFKSPVIREKLPENALMIDFDLSENEPKVHQKDFEKYISEFLSLGEVEIIDRVEALFSYFEGAKK